MFTSEFTKLVGEYNAIERLFSHEDAAAASQKLLDYATHADAVALAESLMNDDMRRGDRLAYADHHGDASYHFEACTFAATSLRRYIRDAAARSQGHVFSAR